MKVRVSKNGRHWKTITTPADSPRRALSHVMHGLRKDAAIKPDDALGLECDGVMSTTYGDELADSASALFDDQDIQREQAPTAAEALKALNLPKLDLKQLRKSMGPTPTPDPSGDASRSKHVASADNGAGRNFVYGSEPPSPDDGNEGEYYYHCPQRNGLNTGELWLYGPYSVANGWGAPIRIY